MTGSNVDRRIADTLRSTTPAASSGYGPVLQAIARPQGNVYNAPVDFELVLKCLLTDFDRDQIRYAVIGGFALRVVRARGKSKPSQGAVR